jgi:uncharacterized protein
MKTITITDRSQIEDIIRKCPYCTVGIIDGEGNPYVIPMNFAWENDTIYLHSGPEGSKVEMVARHPQVCITFCEGHELVYMHKQIACSYSMKSRSVICKGKVRFIEDMDEKRRILDLFVLDRGAFRIGGYLFHATGMLAEGFVFLFGNASSA